MDVKSCRSSTAQAGHARTYAERRATLCWRVVFVAGRETHRACDGSVLDCGVVIDVRMIRALSGPHPRRSSDVRENPSAAEPQPLTFCRG